MAPKTAKNLRLCSTSLIQSNPIVMASPDSLWIPSISRCKHRRHSLIRSKVAALELHRAEIIAMRLASDTSVLQPSPFNLTISRISRFFVIEIGNLMWNSATFCRHPQDRDSLNRVSGICLGRFSLWDVVHLLQLSNSLNKSQLVPQLKINCRSVPDLPDSTETRSNQDIIDECSISRNRCPAQFQS